MDSRFFVKNHKIRIGFVMVSFIFILMLIGFFYTPYDFEAIDVSNKLAFMDSKHILGTDNLGRDILSRMMIGARTSFFIGLSVVVLSLIVGGLIGAFSGYLGGFFDDIISKLIEVLMAFPGILIALIMIAVLGNSTLNMVIALSIMNIPRFSRITRSEYIKYKNMDFIKAEITRGAGTFRIMFIHIFPNMYNSLLITSSLAFASAVMSEAGLSYLGLNANPLLPSFGKMVSDAQNAILEAPWFILIPTLAITLLVMGFNFIADGINELNEKAGDNI